MNLFFDSSDLAKRYIEEKGSDQVQAILSSAAALAVSPICVPSSYVKMATIVLSKHSVEKTLTQAVQKSLRCEAREER